MKRLLYSYPVLRPKACRKNTVVWLFSLSLPWSDSLQYYRKYTYTNFRRGPQYIFELPRRKWKKKEPYYIKKSIEWISAEWEFSLCGGGPFKDRLIILVGYNIIDIILEIGYQDECWRRNEKRAILCSFTITKTIEITKWPNPGIWVDFSFPGIFAHWPITTVDIRYRRVFVPNFV